MTAPVPGPYRPPVPAPPLTRPPVPAVPPTAPAVPTAPDGASTAPDGSGHPAVDAVVQSLVNAASLPLREQIDAYEAAHRTLQETLATIDQA